MMHVAAANAVASAAAKFFDNQDLSIEFPFGEQGRRRRFFSGPSDLPTVPDIDTNAWHNYTWDMSYALHLVCFRSNGVLSEGMPQ